MTLGVSVAASIGLPSIGHTSEPSATESASEYPPPFDREPASRQPSSAGSSVGSSAGSNGDSSAVVATLPDTASYGPTRRGEWRIDADVPQTRLIWEHRVHPHVHEVTERSPPPPPPPMTHAYRRYAAHPYEAGTVGYVLRGSVGPQQRLPGRLHTGQFALEGGQAGPAQGLASLAVRFAFWRLGFDSSVASHFMGPRTPEGPLRTTLVVGSTNGLIAPMLRPKLMWWIGGGVNYAAQPPVPGSTRPEVTVGPNLTSTIDAFPVRPLVLSARADLGTVGGVPMVVGRGTIGFMLKNFEFYAGYEARRLGVVVLQGPMIGARAWF